MKKITECRACGSKTLTPAFSMKIGGRARKSSHYTDDYVLCDPSRHARACGLLQAGAHGAHADIAPSGRHSSNREHLRAAATEALELISGRDCAALDIGCNDGALLSYYPRWVDRYGVDPSELVEEIGSWAWTAKAAFPSAELDSAFGEKKFDIITAVSVLEQIDDPKAFLAAAKARLTDDGIFVLETLYSPSVLARNAVDVLQAGVAAVYSLGVLEWMVRDAGMKIVKGALTSKEGGSIRLFVTHKENSEFDFDPWFERLARLWDEENALAMRAIQPYQSFERRIESVQESFVALLKDIEKRGETAHILGADAQTEALIGWAGGAKKIITAVVDTAEAREQDRLGKNGPPIISETDSRAAEPDYLIAQARYKRETLERWRETIMLGAKMVFVTPMPHVVSAANYATEYGKSIAGGDGAAGVETLRSILAAAGGPRLVAENKDNEAAKSA